ncbi:MAG: response regulator [Puniceicoccaceae bacterium]|nr:MAG: response regulator [Puniceicoccaceae bacterium]
MNPKLYILCIEDEPEVLDAITRDLAEFESHFQLEALASAEEAKALIETLSPEEERIALILCDHVMPGQRGIDLLIELEKSESPALKHSRKVLFTGQAGHEDTIEAINRGGIDHYLAKPWHPEKLADIVRDQLTTFVIRARLDALPFMSTLNSDELTDYLRKHQTMSDV